jgi:hypothetical protein
VQQQLLCVNILSTAGARNQVQCRRGLAKQGEFTARGQTWCVFVLCFVLETADIITRLLNSCEGAHPRHRLPPLCARDTQRVDEINEIYTIYYCPHISARPQKKAKWNKSRLQPFALSRSPPPHTKTNPFFRPPAAAALLHSLDYASPLRSWNASGCFSKAKSISQREVSDMKSRRNWPANWSTAKLICSKLRFLKEIVLF